MKTTIHKADSRGSFDKEWLKTNHTFSFADYYDPDRMNFGALKVLNDDIIEAGKGFGLHPHDNMEIISVPIYGSLEHNDSKNNKSVVGENEIQVMSAGSGIWHSEFNGSTEVDANFLQLWILPKKLDVEPRYDQKTFPPENRRDEFQLIVSPNGRKGSLAINQDAFLSLVEIRPRLTLNYENYIAENIVYVFVIEGKIQIDDAELERRDAVGIEEAREFRIFSRDKSKLLIIEIPKI